MPDSPTTWAGAFARMPVESPPADAWSRTSALLDARRPPAPRAGRWLALAAVLALAVALPWWQPDTTGDRSVDQPATLAAIPTAADPAPSTLAALQAESALLEALLAHARDGRVASGSAAAMAAELETRVAAIDTALADPLLAPDRERALWSERVQALQALVSFEGTRRWLAANGEHYDAALVQVN